MKKYEVILTTRAEADIIAAFQYIDERDHNHQTEKSCRDRYVSSLPAIQVFWMAAVRQIQCVNISCNRRTLSGSYFAIRCYLFLRVFVVSEICLLYFASHTAFGNIWNLVFKGVRLNGLKLCLPWTRFHSP